MQTSPVAIGARFLTVWCCGAVGLIRYGGVSTCFRKEAGAHGKDTWGIFRVHQFEKVEQFCICEGDLEKSAAMQSEMVRRGGAPRHIATPRVFVLGFVRVIY